MLYNDFCTGKNRFENKHFQSKIAKIVKWFNKFKTKVRNILRHLRTLYPKKKLWRIENITKTLPIVSWVLPELIISLLCLLLGLISFGRNVDTKKAQFANFTDITVNYNGIVTWPR